MSNNKNTPLIKMSVSFALLVTLGLGFLLSRSSGYLSWIGYVLVSCSLFLFVGQSLHGIYRRHISPHNRRHAWIAVFMIYLAAAGIGYNVLRWLTMPVWELVYVADQDTVILKLDSVYLIIETASCGSSSYRTSGYLIRSSAITAAWQTSNLKLEPAGIGRIAITVFDNQLLYTKKLVIRAGELELPIQSRPDGTSELLLGVPSFVLRCVDGKWTKTNG